MNILIPENRQLSLGKLSWKFDSSNVGLSGCPSLTAQVEKGMYYIAYSEDDKQFEIAFSSCDCSEPDFAHVDAKHDSLIILRNYFSEIANRDSISEFDKFANHLNNLFLGCAK